VTRLTYLVEVELTKTEGKFAPRDEIAEQVLEALEGADPGSVTAGFEGSEYEVTSWDVTEQEQPKRQRRRKATGG
jgi:hypothetical protein